MVLTQGMDWWMRWMSMIMCECAFGFVIDWLDMWKNLMG
jgi:hypothetical protein